jgi:alanyl-tRNA synthetase
MTRVSAIVKDSELIEKALNQDLYYCLFEETPFYAESGGQDGDTGKGKGDTFELDILDTQKVGPHIVHIVQLVSGEFKSGDRIELEINKQRRQAIKRNHSATHLLNAALSKVTGSETKQKGSSVSSERLRFDFSLERGLAEAEIEDIERLVNSWILSNSLTSVTEMNREEAKASGAKCLEGENYGDSVRVVQLGTHSAEFCGGTHVDSLGDIGFFAVTTEVSIAKGVRRIEAVTGVAALSRFQYLRAIARNVASVLSVDESRILQTIQGLKQRSQRRIDSQDSNVELQFLGSRECNKVSVGLFRLDRDVKTLRDLSNIQFEKKEYGVICAMSFDGAANVIVMVQDYVATTVSANKIIERIADLLNGKGGGKKGFAQCGGPLPIDIPSTIERIANIISQY